MTLEDRQSSWTLR